MRFKSTTVLLILLLLSSAHAQTRPANDPKNPGHLDIDYLFAFKKELSLAEDAPTRAEQIAHLHAARDLRPADPLTIMADFQLALIDEPDPNADPFDTTLHSPTALEPLLALIKKYHHQDFYRTPAATLDARSIEFMYTRAAILAASTLRQTPATRDTARTLLLTAINDMNWTHEKRLHDWPLEPMPGLHKDNPFVEEAKLPGQQAAWRQRQALAKAATVFNTYESSILNAALTELEHTFDQPKDRAAALTSLLQTYPNSPIATFAKARLQ